MGVYDFTFYDLIERNAFLHGRHLDEALEAAARLAGRKCGQQGLDGLLEEA